LVDGQTYVKKVIPRHEDGKEIAQWHAFKAEVSILDHLAGVTFVPQLRCASEFPNITLSEYEEKAGQVYFVMEYVPWQDVEHFLATHDDPESLRRVVKEAAKALDAIHGRGVVHLDIKPGNMLTNGQLVKVIDFGGSILPSLGIVESDFVHHTSDFKPPEWDHYTPSFDWFSLGATAYYGRAMQLLRSTDYERYFPMYVTRLPKDETDLIHFIQTCTVKNPLLRVKEGLASLKDLPYFQ
jgi:serine/threonine protein kinase